MNKQTLNGEWSYRIGDCEWGKIIVPFSSKPVGKSECRRKFSIDKKGERYFLFFEGITYSAVVTLNGQVLGKMQPYCEYRYEITALIKDEDNELKVELEDISPEFGPSAGWSNWGGIIRSVWLETSGKSRIADAFFHSELINDYRDARYTVEVETEGSSEVEVSLFNGKNEVDRYSFSTKSDSPWREIKGVSLWSPDEPNLYTIVVRQKEGDQVVDEYSTKVGFREFVVSGRRFALNGKEIFLQGVCRHEVTIDYGHTLPEEIVREELLAIKKTGCNFTRFVHYPHDKRAVQLADEIGIMISEEPGLWWSDTSNKEISEGSLEVLRRTVLRDRNSPSIVFWLCFNECYFTEQFLIDSARVCRECDPTRLVSGANCMNDDDTLKYYALCGFDFYTQHPYSPTVEKAVESARKLCDKPLMFTEWGGFDVYDNPGLLSKFIHTFYNLYLKNSGDEALAGASFWYWKEGYDYNRGEPACVDGVLKEALIGADGKPTLIYDAFCKTWKEVKTPILEEAKYEYIPFDTLEGKKSARCTSAPDKETLIRLSEAKMKAGVEYLRFRKIAVGPVLQKEEVKGISLVPYIVTKEGLTFQVNDESDCLTLLGATSLRSGYPIKGELGEVAGKIIIEFESGEKQETTLRNGIHFTTAFTTLASSEINPIASKASRFALVSYEKNFEKFVINRLDISLDGKKKVKSVTILASNENYDLLFYGLWS